METIPTSYMVQLIQVLTSHLCQSQTLSLSVSMEVTEESQTPVAGSCLICSVSNRTSVTWTVG